ncbi:hypothetical protein JI739_16035 [Ramlibacter sp. AW1]|uniref:Uncharacterized protein n=1 Tax=Ramlibacter aurantiacus TaxID=2801330 RepID=A0A936ZWK8_9BURK|nr:hypothetical protein [Ramlibacter aurantiacus]MBL0421859.1 hypothetical protein [Ramlibacter aurantiacus]
MAAAHQAQAGRLAELWHRLAGQHVALGCSCTMSGISVTLEDFERDIADFLLAESQRLGQQRVAAFLESPGPLSGQPQAVRATLARLQAGEADDEVSDWLLTRLTRTIESYAALHGPAPEAPLLGGSSAWRKGYRS